MRLEPEQSKDSFVSDPNAPSWSQKLRHRREFELKLSQTELAARTDDLVSQRTISYLENGNTHLLDLSQRRVVALARALRWSLLELQENTGLDLGVSAEFSDALSNPTAKLVEGMPLYALDDAADLTKAISVGSAPRLPEIEGIDGIIAFSSGVPGDGSEIYYVVMGIAGLEDGVTYLIRADKATMIAEYSQLKSLGVFRTQNKMYSESDVRVLGAVHTVISIFHKNKS